MNSFTHLGCKIENKLDGMTKDIREKRARFIQTNNEICQEFNFAHPDTKATLDWIYNSHFTGSPIWVFNLEGSRNGIIDMECSDARNVWVGSENPPILYRASKKETAYKMGTDSEVSKFYEKIERISKKTVECAIPGDQK